ncbi:hypothetical protein ACROYT_G003630 [Oculina patagonica]
MFIILHRVGSFRENFDAMKLIPFVVFVALVLLITLPDESEAVPPAWFVAVAVKLGVKLVKNSYYARCNTRYAPPGVSCPSTVYGVGLSRNQAQNSARAYASKFGDSECARYVGHCDIYKFRK